MLTLSTILLVFIAAGIAFDACFQCVLHPASFSTWCCKSDAQECVVQVLVFFTTAKLTQMFAELCNATGIPVLEIHSRKSQSHRCTSLFCFWCKLSYLYHQLNLMLVSWRDTFSGKTRLP